MKIRKQFKFEGAHVVRNCSTDRCMKSIHGHSYLVDVWLEAVKLDKGCMVLDFSLFKPYVSDFVDSFDHSIVLWDDDNPEYIEAMKKFSERWIILPISPSAEGFALVFHAAISAILSWMTFKNGEHDSLQVCKVGVHETKTGYAETDEGDFPLISDIDLWGITFSPAIMSDWKDQLFYSRVLTKLL